MFTLVLTILVLALAETTNQSNYFRNRLAMETAHKPYSTPKPKSGKGKGKDKFMHLMARAKYAGTGVVGLSGKIAGTVFLSNGVVRVWKKPNNVRDAFTQLVRGVFSGVSTSWKSLTSSEINSWITAATLAFSKKVFATAYPLKGNSFYQRVNNTLISIGVAPVTTAPGIATPAFVIVGATAVADVSSTSFGVTIDEFGGAAAIPADTYIKVYATRQRNIGKSRFGNSDYRYIGFYTNPDVTAPLDIYAEYFARFGTLVAGQRIGLALEVVTAPTGEFGASGKFYLDTIVVP